MLLLLGCGEKDPPTPEKTLFSRLTASETGIDFENKFSETQKFNLFTYRNMYNGGGVAIGDINNDGLPDIYFTSNQGDNKLYLNEGGFEFKDITKAAGVDGQGFWTTGVSMVDVNADGLLDIYVLNSGLSLSGKNDRKNELLINQGNLTFEEKAKEYKLDRGSFSVHATFFDYDGDGDLDCYLLNNNYTGKRNSVNRRYLKEKRSGISKTGGDKLLRNENGKFTDVSKEAGIYQGSIGFGLDISVGDVTGDKLPDIYISNDFWERDYLYINQGDGKFTEEVRGRTGHISKSSMGNAIGDINNDGFQDIYVTDMLPPDIHRTKTMTDFPPYRAENNDYFESYHFQFVQNTLQVNNGNGTFRELGFLSETAMTDWSWAALMFDFQNDGWRDIFVTNGVYRDITDKDFTEDFLSKEAIAKIVRQQGTFDVFDFLDKMPSKKISNFAFKNDRDNTFTNRSDSLGFYKPSFSNGAAYGDLDNDGDLDIVINNIEDKAFIYENKTDKYHDNNYLRVEFEGGDENPFGVGAHVELYTRGNRQIAENIPARTFQSTVPPYLHFGLNKINIVDSLVVTWTDGQTQTRKDVKANRVIEIDKDSSEKEPATQIKNNVNPIVNDVTEDVINGDAEHVENSYVGYNDEPLLPHMLSAEGPDLTVGDVNNDGLDDFYVTSSMDGKGKLFIQQEDGTMYRRKSLDFEAEEAYESAAANLFDIDGDGDLDLMVAPGGNQYKLDSSFYRVRVYANNGDGDFTKAMHMAPDVNINASTICVEDIDGDGDKDVFIGARVTPNDYGVDPRSYLLENDGSGNWTDVTPERLKRPGMVTDAVWADYDNDGDSDLVVVGEWMPISLFENQDGTLQHDRFIDQSHGWWNRIEKADLDSDGDSDFVLGNWGMNSKFKASSDKPMTMFVNDFDDNGSNEFVINTYLPDEDRPHLFHTYEDLVDVIPVIKERVEDRQEYANKTYEDIFSYDQRKDAQKKEVHTLRSSLLVNTEGGLDLQELPLEAQASPVFGIVPANFSGNSTTDLLLLGNMHRLKPEVGRLDSNYGVFLHANKPLDYSFQPYHQTDTLIRGEVRDASKILLDGERHIVITRNDDELMILK